MPEAEYRRLTNLSAVTLVRQLRRRSQAEVASEVGISSARMSQIERGLEPPLALQERLAEYLGADIDVLFPEDGGKSLREHLRSELGMKRKKRRKQ